MRGEGGLRVFGLSGDDAAGDARESTDGVDISHDGAGSAHV